MNTLMYKLVSFFAGDTLLPHLLRMNCKVEQSWSESMELLRLQSTHSTQMPL